MFATLGISACTALPDVEATVAGEASAPAPEWSAPAQGLHSSYIATARADTLSVSVEPGGDELTRLEQDHTPIVLGITDTPGTTTHVEVLVPGRPNGRTGWVSRDDVDITWTNYRIRITLESRRVDLYDGATLVVSGTAAIGTETNPTPTGRTFVTETLVNPDAGGLYGPFALGLALWSDTLTEYAGGDGQVALHGTHRPDLLGERVSHGCVRVHNDLIGELAGRVPLGTPVDIIA
ncbi:MAG: L,D-transpeptidase [Actinomycetota bacterium]|nr:L,D-transpeptidase [Actinomycetota bacterium]